MERRITEETVTKSLLCWLESNGWEIVCYDFPQSGMGICLHPNAEFRTTKNKDAFIPDIVAHKTGTVLFFENKDRFALDDFHKVERLRTSSMYSDSITKLLCGIKPQHIFYGIGMPASANNILRCQLELSKVDFIMFYMPNGTITAFYDPKQILTSNTTGMSLDS